MDKGQQDCLGEWGSQCMQRGSRKEADGKPRPEGQESIGQYASEGCRLDRDAEEQSCEQSQHDGDYTKGSLAGRTEFEVRRDHDWDQKNEKFCNALQD